MTFILVYFCIIRIECGSLRSFGIRGLFVALLLLYLFNALYVLFLVNVDNVSMFRCFSISVE